MTKWLIVGAGLTGATLAERIATERREEVLVIDRNSYVGGTASDYTTPEGLLVHRYGPHTFHTNSEDIWRYVQRFASWLPIVTKIEAMVGGTGIPLPVGFRGIDLLFGSRAEEIKEALIQRYGKGSRVPISSLRRETAPSLQLLTNGVYEHIFRGYNLKHWGMLPEALLPSVTARIPIVVGDQQSYHADKYEAVPIGGYTKMVQNMLDHPRILVELGTSYRSRMCPGSRVIYSGAVDEYFKYSLGRLPYRSVRFEMMTHSKEWVQPVTAYTFPNEHLYTRVSETKHITKQVHPRTIQTYEYPVDEGEPLYPVPTQRSQEIFRKYSALMGASEVRFCGRLGDYQYYNMDQAIGSALALFRRLS